MDTEPIPTIEELQKQITDLEANEESRQQQLQMQVQNLQQQLQQITNTTIGTIGQIKQLEDILTEQKREQYRLEGTIRAFSSMMPQQQ